MLFYALLYLHCSVIINKLNRNIIINIRFVIITCLPITILVPQYLGRYIRALEQGGLSVLTAIFQVNLG